MKNRNIRTPSNVTHAKNGEKHAKNYWWSHSSYSVWSYWEPPNILKILKPKRWFVRHKPVICLSFLNFNLFMILNIKADRTHVHSLKSRYMDLCHQALKKFVFVRGSNCAELLTRSILARDWLSCNEPRGPRPIVKNFLDDLRKIDDQTSNYLAPGHRPTKSQKSGSHRGSYAPSQMTNLNIQR